MSYFEFIHRIDKSKVKIIFELGSRDLKDGVQLLNYFEDSVLYAFECNPDCLQICNHTVSNLNKATQKRLFLIDKAVSVTDGEISFFPFDLDLYNNMGASSMLEIDFSSRHPTDPDYNRQNPQKKIKVDGVRIDSFLEKHEIEKIDLLCIDLQGYELEALKSLGSRLLDVTYIITECSIVSTYKQGAVFSEVKSYLECYGFKYVCSNEYGENDPDYRKQYFSEFDAMFVKNLI